MHYEIEVNVARKGFDAVWRSLKDENGDDCIWFTEHEAKAALLDEDRGKGARLMFFDRVGISSELVS